MTLNNPQKKGYIHEVIRDKLSTMKSLTYYCMSDEIANTHHTHVYLLFKAPIRFSTLKNLFPEGHWEKAYGTSVQNREYIFKEGKWINDAKKETNLCDTHEEWGTIPQERQGARNDYTELYELIVEGKSNYDILEEKPEFISQLERMDRVRQIVQEEKYKNVFRNISVEYMFGDTGSGKTRRVMERYGYENVYRVTNIKNSYDQYKGQDVILYEEFQSSVAINQMLVYLDGYPVMLPCRYADKVACYTKVFIMTNVELFEQYVDVQKYNPEVWNAFLRRINTVQHFHDGVIDTYSLFEYLQDFRKLTVEQLSKIPFTNQLAIKKEG